MLAGPPARPSGSRSKSVRVRGVLDAVLALPGYAGVLAYTLAEALWLAEPRIRIDDVVVGYPTADRAAIARLAHAAELAARVTLMVDSVAQLDLIDAVVAPGAAREHPRLPRTRRVLDSPRPRPHRRAALARAHAGRRRARSREAIVAPPRIHPRRHDGATRRRSPASATARAASPAWGACCAGCRRSPIAELADRRGSAVARGARGRRPRVRQRRRHRLAREHARPTRPSPRSRRAAGCSAATSSTPTPPSARHPRHRSRCRSCASRRPEMATLLGGGWIASGPPGAGPAAAARLADRALDGAARDGRRGADARHRARPRRAAASATGSGCATPSRASSSEHLNEFAPRRRRRRCVERAVPTYRGEGKAFL